MAVVYSERPRIRIPVAELRRKFRDSGTKGVVPRGKCACRISETFRMVQTAAT